MPLSALLDVSPTALGDLETVLHALGFADAPRAVRLVLGCAKTDDERAALRPLLTPLFHELSESAEPPRALLNFSNLCDRMSDKVAFYTRLRDDEAALRRLTRLFSWSQALSDALIRAPERLDLIFEAPQIVSRPVLRRGARECADLDALRRFRKAQFLRIGLLDLDRNTWRDESDFNLVVTQISDLAQVVAERALELLTDDTSGFCVIMMGKGGARELNYSSDIDLIFLAEERADATQLGEKLLRALGDQTAHGFLWRTDLRLRPDGTNGPLVTPFAYALSYYESFAGAWEHQALIKARVVAGDAKLGRRFRRFTRQITWAKRPDDDHLRAVFEMKKRSEKTADGSDPRNVKSGPGGIRDAEWVVQQLQMMVGPSRPRARAKATLRALDVLEELDAISPDEARNLRDGYLWLRVAEHRLQIWNEQAVRVLPEKDDEKAHLARRLGCSWRGRAATRWLNEEEARHRTDVRALCERLFWAFSSEEADLESALLHPALQNPQARARLERLANGTPTRPLPAPLARQIRAALPGALRPFERAANAEKALVAFENLAEASGNRLSLLRSLDASPQLAGALWTLLGGAPFAAQTLVKFPQLLDLAANRTLLSQPRGRDEARAACRDYCLAFRDRKAALRRWRARELLRIALRDLVLNASPHEITSEIAWLANSCVDLALEEARRELRESSSLAFAVIGMGKMGSVEMHYASDCDVVFVAQSFGGTGLKSSRESAVKLAESLVRWSGERTEDGPGFELDARLRFGGASGALATPLGALQNAVENGELAVWERQAWTRARFACGDGSLGARAMVLAHEAAFPTQWKAEWGDELRHIKNRVEKERAVKGAVYDVKLGPGTLSDIEWSAQWLAMKHGAQHQELQTPSTRFQLQAAHKVELLSGEEHRALQEAYTFLRRAELRLQLAREGGARAVKKGSPDAQIWARAIFPDEAAPLERFEREWNEHTNRAREVFERVRDEL